jgi:hypothetical protein
MGAEEWSPNRLSPKLRQLEGSSTVRSAGLKALWLSRKTRLKVCLTLDGDRGSKFLSHGPLVDNCLCYDSTVVSMTD